ncbi:UNVERIFIED_CONTAM: hypothetical protein Slati_3449200 [Sesamum latifolium]|uniref:Uncharacterized protein n=1 Tax=Sesamum latifolium TaxID=2727402 RepID=A0AAW2UG82_9LAMI
MSIGWTKKGARQLAGREIAGSATRPWVAGRWLCDQVAGARSLAQRSATCMG